jgi:hypothetical protein
MDAFARAAYSTCNLCAAEGISTVIAVGDDDLAWRMMDEHTNEAHPDHVALLASGAEYRPAFPTVFDTMAGG